MEGNGLNPAEEENRHICWMSELTDTRLLALFWGTSWLAASEPNSSIRNKDFEKNSQGSKLQGMKTNQCSTLSHTHTHTHTRSRSLTQYRWWTGEIDVVLPGRFPSYSWVSACCWFPVHAVRVCICSSTQDLRTSSGFWLWNDLLALPRFWRWTRRLACVTWQEHKRICKWSRSNGAATVNWVIQTHSKYVALNTFLQHCYYVPYCTFRGCKWVALKRGFNTWP